MDSMVKSYGTGTNMETLQQTYVTEDKFIPPLVKILEEVTPKPGIDRIPSNPSASISESLDILFPEQQYQDKDLQKARQILGELSQSFTDEELKRLISEIKFLVENWLDSFERETFKGLTLAELLHERGGI